MKKSLLTISILVLSTGLVLAQGDMTKGNQGDKALLFSLTGLNNLGAGNFEGGVGMRFHFSKDMSFRFGVGFDNRSTTRKSTGTTVIEEKSSSMTIDIAPGIEMWMMKNGPVAGYVGAQVMFRLGSTTVENPNFVNNNKNETNSTTFGAGVFIGAQWFPWSNIGLGAEYQLGFSTSSGKSKVTVNGVAQPETDAPSVTNISLGSTSGASFTLAIYM